MDAPGRAMTAECIILRSAWHTCRQGAHLVATQPRPLQTADLKERGLVGHDTASMTKQFVISPCSWPYLGPRPCRFS